MKILLAINSLSTGGAEVFTAALARALRRAGCEVVLFLYAGILDEKGVLLAEQLNNEGIRVVSVNASSSKKKLPAKEMLAVLSLAKLMMRFRPDVVHSHLEQTDFIVAIACTLLPVHSFRRVRTVHNVCASRSLPALAHRWLERKFDVTVACGEVVAREYPFMGSRGQCIENGIDVEIANAGQGIGLRERLGISPEARILVSVGSFDLRKGILQKAQDITVDAMVMVKADDVVVCFLGDGEMRMAIEERAKRHNVFDKCRFVGKVVDVAIYLAIADAVLMPSRFEGLPIGAIEAACAGKPLVLSSIPQFQPFATPAANVATVDDAMALALAIDATLNTLESARQEATALAPVFRDRFCIDITARKYRDLYSG